MSQPLNRRWLKWHCIHTCIASYNKRLPFPSSSSSFFSFSFLTHKSYSAVPFYPNFHAEERNFLIRWFSPTGLNFHFYHSIAKAQMDVVVSEVIEGVNSVQIRVNWNSKTYHFLRRRTELLSQTLQRIQSALFAPKWKGVAKKQKNKNAAEETENGGSTGTIYLKRKDGSTISETYNSFQGFKEASVLCINDDILRIHVNPPRASVPFVNSQTLVGSEAVHITTGTVCIRCRLRFPIFPLFRVEYGDLREFRFEWYRKEGQDLKQIHTKRRYTPTIEDLNALLEFRVFHPSFADLCASCLIGPIIKGPPSSWRDVRNASFNQRQNSETTGAGIYRVLTFNILAPIYVKTPEIAALSFRECPFTAVDFNYRKLLITQEILDINPDIFCLQEVYIPFYSKYLCEFFQDDYYSWIAPKVGSNTDACASFFKRSKFDVVAAHRFAFNEELKNDKAFKQIVKEIKVKWPHFMDFVLPHLKTVFQISIVKETAVSKTAMLSHYIVATSHLYFHPKAEEFAIGVDLGLISMLILTEYTNKHIRALQMAVFVRLIKRIKKNYQSLGNLPLILLGDLNCTPNTMGIQLLKEGQVLSTHPDWHFGLEFKWDAGGAERDEESDVPDDKEKDIVTENNSDAEEEVDFTDALSEGEGMNLQLPEDFGPLHNCYEGMDVPFTHYVDRFQGTLDYIFVSEDFKLLQCLPAVSLKEIQPYGGLMSPVYPSDHISIAVDLQFPSK